MQARQPNPAIPVHIYFIYTADGRKFQTQKPVLGVSLAKHVAFFLKQLHKQGEIDDDELVRQTVKLNKVMKEFNASFVERRLKAVGSYHKRKKEKGLAALED